MTKKGENTKDIQKNYVFKLYRYMVLPEKISKGKFYLISALAHMGKDAAEIKKLIGGTEASIKKFIQHFEEGKGQDPDKWFGKKMSDPECCSAYASLMNLIKL